MADESLHSDCTCSDGERVHVFVHGQICRNAVYG